jgi:cytochrome b6-f complex iron-sulfur subunit
MGCTSCTRRALLKGIGIATVSLTVVGCTQTGSSLPSATSSSCAGGICIDLANPANAELANVDGAMVIDTANDTIMVIRASATTVIALSAICTHAGCSMNFVASTHILDCPCHGSQFDEHGQVIQGPARKPLHVYTATLANNVITVAG